MVRLFKQSFLFIDQAILSGSNFMLSILLVSTLGIESFGTYVILFIPVLFLSSLQQSFIVAPLYSLYPKEVDKKNYLISVYTLQLFFSFISIILLILFLPIYIEFMGLDVSIFVVVSTSLIGSLYCLNDFFRRKNIIQHKYGLLFLTDCFVYASLPLALLITHATYSWNLEVVIFIHLISHLTGICINLYYSSLKPSKKITNSYFKKHWNYCKYLVGTSFLQWFTGNAFIIGAASMLGPKALGSFRLVQSVVGILNVLFLALENIVPIKAARVLKSKGQNQLMNYFKETILRYSIPVGLILIFITVFRREIINFLTHESVEITINLLVLYCGIYVLVYLGTMLRFLIRTIEDNHVIFWSYIITSVASTILVIPIIHWLQIYGVLLGIAITQIVSISWFVFHFKRKRIWFVK